MRPSRVQLYLARLLFLAYVAFTATYCFLAYLPFTYQQVHVGELLPWLTQLVRMHALLFWPALALVLLTIAPDLRAKTFLSRAFAIVGIVAGLALLVHPLLPNLSNDSSSLAWCLACCVPLLWLAAIDWLRQSGSRLSLPEWDPGPRIFAASWRAAVYLAVLNFGIVILRSRGGHGLRMTTAQWSFSLVCSLISHLVVFLLLFAVMDVVYSMVKLVSPIWRSKVLFSGQMAIIAALIALALRQVIFPPLSFGGDAATSTAAVLSLTLVLFAAGVGLRMRDAQNPLESGLDLILDPFNVSAEWRRGKLVVALFALALLASLLSLRASRLDWEFLLQKMAVMFIWLVAFAVFYSFSPTGKKLRRIVPYSLATIALFSYLTLGALGVSRLGRDQSRVATGRLLDDYADYDVSFRLVDAMLQPRSSAPTPDFDDTFYGFLVENTHIPRSIHLAPVNINLAPQLTKSPGRIPNIFIFVIDSLRRDYLSPYNPAVTFTPSINSLARDSAIFQNAFTHYGGTGLSEPSIWVGGMMLHQEYMTPFAPMNTLQKLVQANHYQEWISNDSILQQVVPASPRTTELDEHTGAMYYDFCQTLQEITGRLPAAKSGGGPVFVYTQPQDIHVSVINREGRSVPQAAAFPPGFDPAYASRLERMDGCLGKFMGQLRNNGMYDDSIIILASDHGDSLGEHGRWGHAYTIFPEIVRIPLIVHLPAWLRPGLQFDPQSIAFLTDITPSLYYLLGQKPVRNEEFFGRPLFTATLDEQKSYMRDSYLVVSSYAPVYGLLSQNGHLLYIADAVNYKDYAYELTPDGGSQELQLPDSERAEMQSKIRADVNAIAKFYGLR